MFKATCIFLFVTSLFFSCGLLQDPVTYNDKIVNEQSKVIDAVEQLMLNIGEAPRETLEQMRLKGIIRIDSSIKIVEAMKDFRGNTELKEAALNQFGVYKNAMETGFKEIISLDLVADPSLYEKYDELLNDFIEKGSKADEDFIKAQQAFAHKFDMKFAKE